MNLKRNLIRRWVTACPADDSHVYEVCQAYVNRYRGDNNEDIHNNGELRLLQERLPTAKVVFDVGANVGKWAKLALGINPGLQLHCFEPSRNTFATLAGHKFPANVILNNFGLSSQPGEQVLHVFDELSGLNSLYKREGLEDGWHLNTQQKTETIQLDTLDNYCAQHQIAAIDFLKLDVEGHELEAFRGARQLIQQGQVQCIQFEYGGRNIDAHVLLKYIFDFFKPFPYQFYKVFPEALRPIERYDQRLENFQYSNWAILRKG